MYPARYFPARYFAPRYWPKVGAAAEPAPLVIMAFHWRVDTSYPFRWRQDAPIYASSAVLSRPFRWRRDTRYPFSWRASRMPITTDFRITGGPGQALSFPGSPLPGDVTDITGWTLRVRVYTAAGSLLYTLTEGAGITVDDAEAGEYTWSLTAAQTTSMGAGSFRYDVWRTDSGSEAELANGALILVA